MVNGFLLFGPILSLFYVYFKPIFNLFYFQLFQYKYFEVISKLNYRRFDSVITPDIIYVREP